MKNDKDLGKLCYDVFKNSGEVGYFMLYNALNDAEERSDGDKNRRT